MSSSLWHDFVKAGDEIVRPKGALRRTRTPKNGDIFHFCNKTIPRKGYTDKGKYLNAS